jgi:copper chaperone NosL
MNSRVYRHLKQLALISLTVLLLACQSKPEPINFGEDYCDYCKMSIVDPKYGAELVTDKGRIYKFDAVECMIPFIHENGEMTFSLQLVVAFDEPKKLFPIDQVVFAHSKIYQSPMGANVAAFVDKSKMEPSSEIMSWKKLVDKHMSQP